MTETCRHVLLHPACSPCKPVKGTNLSVVHALLKGSKVYDTHRPSYLEESNSKMVPHTENKTKLNRDKRAFYASIPYVLGLDNAEVISTNFELFTIIIK